MLKNTAFVLPLLLLALSIPNSAQTTSEQEKNKAVARSFFEDVLSPGKLEKYSDSHTPDFVAHGSNGDYTLAEDMAAARDERTAMPDMQMKVNQMVAEGDLVAVRWTAWGTNTPEWASPQPAKKSGFRESLFFALKLGKCPKSGARGTCSPC